MPRQPVETSTTNIPPDYEIREEREELINSIVVVGVCPACRAAELSLEESYLCVLSALCCFPFDIGKRKRCSNCGARFK